MDALLEKILFNWADYHVYPTSTPNEGIIDNDCGELGYGIKFEDLRDGVHKFFVSTLGKKGLIVKYPLEKRKI